MTNHPVIGPHEIDLPYGSERLRAGLPHAVALTTLDIGEATAAPDPAAAVRAALAAPIGMPHHALDGIRPGESVVVIVSDSFRQTRADLMIPVLLDELSARGIAMTDVSIVFATGTHRAPTVDEQRMLLGERAFELLRGRLFAHDAHDPAAVVRVGVTRRGTPVEINRRVHEADRVIVTGTVVLHYFAGFGGGRKAVVPGVASVQTIAHNHAMNLCRDSDQLDPAVRIGVMEGNPVAEDMDEAARMVRVEAILNTVLDRHGRIVEVFAGEMQSAHAVACDLARRLFVVPLAQRADLVIAASPSTRNFVQTHKALFNAWQALAPGGRIVMAAPCVEGLGGEQFLKWLRLGDRAAVIAGLRRHSEINGQTALSTLEKAPSMLMVTEMNATDVAFMGARKAASLQSAIDQALIELAAAGLEHPRCCVMPSAAYTVPMLA